MEPVSRLAPFVVAERLKVVSIIEKDALVKGLVFHFSGEEEDAEGNVISEFVSIDLTVPPLNLPAIARYQSKLTNMPTDPIEHLQLAVEFVGAALKRNYRGVPRWLIEQSVDLTNARDLISAVMTGLMVTTAGKAPAATPTGTESAPT